MKWNFKAYLLKTIRISLWTMIIILSGSIILKLYNMKYPSVTQKISGKDIRLPVATDNHLTSAGNFLNVPKVIPNFLPKSAYNADPQIPLLILGKSNTLVFRDIVTAESMGKLENQLNEMSHKLSPNTPIFLVLDTPGGDVEAGLHFIDMARGIPQEVNTITLFAASMGFHIVQGLSSRYITPSGTLMSHRVSINGLEGHVPGEAVVRLNKIIRQSVVMDKEIAKRIGMTFEDYENLIHDEYWVSGADAVADKVADETVLINCADDLNGSYVQSIQTLFGTIKVEWSNCPTIEFPLSVNSQALLDSISDKNDKKSMEEFISTLLNNKKQFIKKYILNQSYKQFINE